MTLHTHDKTVRTPTDETRWTVWKYELPLQETFTLGIPVGATLLHIEVQGVNRPCLWVQVHPDAPERTYSFVLVGTGNEHYEPEQSLRYVGTFQMYNGSRVFHLYWRYD